jgi:hypothetical protein
MTATMVLLGPSKRFVAWFWFSLCFQQEDEPLVLSPKTQTESPPASNIMTTEVLVGILQSTTLLKICQKEGTFRNMFTKHVKSLERFRV